MEKASLRFGESPRLEICAFLMIFRYDDDVSITWGCLTDSAISRAQQQKRKNSSLASSFLLGPIITQKSKEKREEDMSGVNCLPPKKTIGDHQPAAYKVSPFCFKKKVKFSFVFWPLNRVRYHTDINPPPPKKRQKRDKPRSKEISICQLKIYRK